MTRQYDQTIHCPSCGSQITNETSTGRWIRNNRDLDSVQEGISVMDNDMTIHRFRTELGRDFQCLMIIEIKTRGGQLSSAQRDTAWMLDQMLRNRRETPTWKPPRQAGNGLYKVKSSMTGRTVYLKALGLHVLRFEGLGPSDSQWMTWDNKQIDAGQLTKLLRFDLDPDTLELISWRSHHAIQLQLPTNLIRLDDPLANYD